MYNYLENKCYTFFRYFFQNIYVHNLLKIHKMFVKIAYILLLYILFINNTMIKYDK